MRWSGALSPSRCGAAVLVKMRLATICGSDLHTLKGLRTELPAFLGHEGVGVVTAMGERGEDRPVEIEDRFSWSRRQLGSSLS